MAKQQNKKKQNIPKKDIEEENVEKEKEIKKKKNHIFVHITLILLIGISFVFFGFNLFDKDSSIQTIINSLFLTLFTILFGVISITYNRRKKGLIFLSSLLLFGYFLLQINSHIQFVKTPMDTVPNFQGKSLTSVIQWASKNNMTIHQEYEYSDMIPEYKVISQSTSSNNKELTVSISEGANPSKEIIVPNMVTWDDKRVLNYVLENHLSNVKVDFETSDHAQNTVMEQSANGSLKRDSELHLTFSYGEELGFDEVSLIDFTNKSKFEIEFYMKQHKLRYEFEEDFSNKIKKGLAIKQSIQASEKVKVDDEKIVVTISKGPKIKVPELTKMSMTEITKWAINNKIKLNFDEEYDDSVKENNIIKADRNKGDVIEQGTVVKVTLSRGTLKMPKFKDLNSFYQWANKYNINYEEKHEFSDSVAAGEVIEYSYKAGQAIKRDDTIIVTISDGAKKKVPDLEGLSKSEAIAKLDKADLNYNFIYKNSNKKKNIVISQSIKAGSEISSGTTITITLSNGEKEDSSVEKRKNTSDSNKTNNNNKQNNNNSNNSNNGGSNSGKSTPTPAPTPTPTPTPTPQPDPEPTYEKVTVYIYDELIKSSPTATCSAIKGTYPKLSFSCSYVCGPYNGALVNSSSIDEHTFSTNDTINLRISDNNKC